MVKEKVSRTRQTFNGSVDLDVKSTLNGLRRQFTWWNTRRWETSLVTT